MALISRKSDAATAINYTLNQWAALTRYAKDGLPEIDHNIAERGVAMYCMIGTCMLNGINPKVYLTHMLDRTADHPVNRVDELLPWVVADLLPRTGTLD
ncbi:transposase domain-containing protein [Jeongeupia naejangsanensis]|uniref:transposase domain-containing protein n=1 Tax=Jeongeupia naejangsanensis TaxID=613195 RepID=UPI001EEFE562